MKIFITLILLLSFTNFASAQELLTLEHAVDAALEHNHGVQINRIETEIAANRATRGYAGQLPTVDITGGATGSFTDQEVTPGSFFRNLIPPQGGESSPPPTTRFDGVTSTQIQSAIGTQFVIYDGMKGRMRYTLLESARELADLQYRAEMEGTILAVSGIYLRGQFFSTPCNSWRRFSGRASTGMPPCKPGGNMARLTNNKPCRRWLI